MGFDNECILNIESLAGEYFCPVCRTLVYPNEAIQSQCTHLYCKPCLTYIVGTTRACPYDGYLVTEADSKPLIESNKALAETIGKIVVRCLYHRSGCSFQGSLSDCTSHCPGCSFGNSPVVCNRCGLQIVHRQVQEHAQTCSGVNPQQQQGTESLQNGAIAGAASVADRSQTTVQPAAAPPSSQVQSMPAVAAAPPPTAGQVVKQQTNLNPPVQSGAPNTDQWYQQQQQQYQQNYQQYPGYDQYQQPYQQYYPYQQPPAQQFPPAQQPYAQPQSQPQPNRPQVQSQPQVLPPQHVQVLQAHMPPPGNLPPPPPPIYPQQHMQVAQYQQPQSRPPPQPAYQHAPPQLQNHPQPYPYHQPQPQSQQMTAHAATGQSQMHPPPMHVHPSGQSQPHPPQMIMPSNQQESALVTSQGQIPNIPPHPSAQQPGYSVHPRSVMQQIQQPPPQQYVQQQPFQSQQPHQYPMQSQMVPPGPLYPVQQMPPQQVNYGGRPMVPNHVQQPHSYGAAPARPMGLGLNEPPGQLNYGNRTNNMPQVSSEQQFAVQSGLSATPPGVESQKTGESAEPVDPTKGLNLKSEGEDGSRKIETPDKVKVSGGETSDSLPGANSAEIAKDTGRVALEKVENPVDDSSVGNNVKNPQNDSVPGQLTDQGRHNFPTMPNAQLPRYPSNTFRPQGPGNFPQPGQPGCFHPNNPVSGQFGQPQDHYNQGGFPRNSIGPDDHFRPQDHINPRDNERQNNFDRRSSGLESNMNRFNRHPDQGEFEPEPKRFPRASHENSPKFGNYFDNNNNNNNPQHGSSPNFGAPSHFLPPYRSDGPQVGFNENNRGRIEPYGFGRNHMEASRSPGREYFGVPPRGFGVDFDGQDMRGPPHKFPNHIPHGESYGGNNPGQPRFGEPGFRSSYSHPEFPNDGRFYAGETDSFDKMRRKPFTAGWCRICKIDCETVEGLDMHSQTREHQKVTMDMVINIKRQNTKKRKTLSDHSSFEEGRKQRNPGFKSRGANPK